MVSTADIGRDLGQARFRVDASKAMELARALFDDDPIYHDAEAATDAGFAGVPVPLTASVLAAHFADGGAEGPALALGLDLARLLHGEASWEYVRPLRIGDDLRGRIEVADVKIKAGARGGQMTLVVLLTEFRDTHGDVVLRKRDTIIERGA